MTLWVFCVPLKSPLAYNMYLFNVRMANHILIKILLIFFFSSNILICIYAALFLIDNMSEVIVWQGWWPEGDEETDNIKTGSAHARFNVDRRCALQTTLDYCREKAATSHTKPVPANLVYAGMEPVSFTNLFPYWQQDMDITDIMLKGKLL